ncbi:uncharacterized protein LOC112555736 isoform X1 [Pomacea canaliculata]|nr:uncharacterized protein LOC112555736 isoform X1 [Pomacea canaliculata]
MLSTSFLGRRSNSVIALLNYYSLALFSLYSGSIKINDMLKSAVTSLLLRCQTMVLQTSPVMACERWLHDDSRHGSKSEPPGNRSMNKAPCTLTEDAEQDVLQRARILKGLGQSEISVDLLMMVDSKPAEKVGRLLAERKKMIKFLCKVLGCSEPELEALKQKNKHLKKVYSRSVKDLEEKVRFLQQYSISNRDLRDAPEILNTRMSVLEARMVMLHKLKEEGKLHFEKWPLNTIAATQSIFNSRVKQALENQREIDGSALSYASIAKCLGVTEKDICDVSINIPNRFPSVAYNKIRYLLDQGLHRHDILNHIYVLKHPMSKLKVAFKRCHEIGFTQPPINMVLSFIRSARLPQSSGSIARNHWYLCTLLGVTKSQLPHKESCRPVWSADRLVIKRNYDFLTSNGFGKEDILSCITILAHDSNILQEYYQKLWQRPDVKPFAGLEVWQVRKRVLNLLQYVLEKDMNFHSVAFNAYVELGDEGHIKDGISEIETDHV